MESPNYVLYAHNAEFVPKENYQALKIAKKIIWGYIAVVAIFSLLFQENMFSLFPLYIQGMIVIAAIWTLITRTEERKPNPFEIRFYDEYLVLYTKKKRYDDKTTRMDIFKIYYKDVTECVYKKKYERIDVYGLKDFIYYNYNKDGTIPEQPNYHRMIEAVVSFYTMYDKNIDFVAEIEQHSLIKVTIEE